ncbi:40328_t:CDS:2, partial [Gigaspora margarita]
MSDTESVELHNIMNDDEHLANVDYFTDEEGNIESGINTGTNSKIASLITNNSEKETSMLFTSKILANWAICEELTFASMVDITNLILAKKLDQKNIMPMAHTHNHELSVDAITFEQEKKFSNEMINDIEFLTQHCRIGATIQRRYLE